MNSGYTSTRTSTQNSGVLRGHSTTVYCKPGGTGNAESFLGLARLSQERRAAEHKALLRRNSTVGVLGTIQPYTTSTVPSRTPKKNSSTLLPIISLLQYVDFYFIITQPKLIKVL